jgi:AcrR family transcriptional regulator
VDVSCGAAAPDGDVQSPRRRPADEEGAITTGTDPGRPRGRQRSPESHRAILAATREVLDEVGYFRLTVEGVAARAGVGKTTVYRWWPSKSALVLEAIGADLTKPPPPSGDLRADIHAVMTTMLEDLRGPPAATLLALGAEMLHETPVDAGPVAFFQADRGAVEDMLEDAARRGDLPPDVDAGLLLDIYAGTLLYRLLCRRPTEGVIEKLVGLLVEGEIPRSGPA